MIIRGKVHRLSDDINTDDIIAAKYLVSTDARELGSHCMESIKPDFCSKVKEGDIIVAGKNFGTGSSRPAARLFKLLGIEAVAADSVNGLFFRNSINYGLPAFNCPGVAEHFQEGEVAQIDPRAGTIKNLTTGRSLQTGVLPEMLMKIIDAGGIHELLAKEGYIESVVR